MPGYSPSPHLMSLQKGRGWKGMEGCTCKPFPTLPQEVGTTFPELLEHLPLCIRNYLSICHPDTLWASQQEGLGFFKVPSPVAGSWQVVTFCWTDGWIKEHERELWDSSCWQGCILVFFFWAKGLFVSASLSLFQTASPAESTQWNSVPFSK